MKEYNSMKKGRKSENNSNIPPVSRRGMSRGKNYGQGIEIQ
jgi:hypothetical protein